jgi:hypothetical protein
MSVHSWRELARTATHLIGASPEFERRFVATLNDPNTTAALIVQTIGADHGTAFPDVSAAKCYDLELNEAYEGNRYWVELVARYKIPEADERDIGLLPWLRPDVWKFQTQGVAVPALYYYQGNGSLQADQRPLTNSASDFFEGLLVDEAQQKVTIQANRQQFPSALAAAVTNCVNDSSYLGFPQDSVKVQGISGEQAVEQVNGVEVRYWKITSELLCRQTGWNLLLPDVGFNFIEGGVKKRADVEGPDGEQVASANPIALDGNGGKQAGDALPAILTRRVYKRITMSTYFGTPPT